MVPVTEKVTVTFEVVTATLAVVMSRLLRTETLAPVGLSRHPSGMVKIKVRPLPGAKSSVLPSLSTMSPRAV